jgi:hypothetical protein
MALFQISLESAGFASVDGFGAAIAGVYLVLVAIVAISVASFVMRLLFEPCTGKHDGKSIQESVYLGKGRNT